VNKIPSFSTTRGMMDKVLQAGLAAGMSATDGIHIAEPRPVDPSFDGLKSLLPMSFVSNKSMQITLHGAKGDIQVPVMNIGAWSWGDKPTWHWSPDQLPGVVDA
jgi:hypothetical protein